MINNPNPSDINQTFVIESLFITGDTNTFVTGGTFNNLILTLNRNDDVSVVISGFTDVYTTGATYSNGFITFDRNDMLSAYTVNLSSLTGDTNTFLTGLTYSNNQLTAYNNDNTSLSVMIDSFTGLSVNFLSATTITATTFYGDGSNLTGISTQDTYVTGGTYSNGTSIFTNNTGGTFSVDGYYTGYTAGIDVYVTGGTYAAGTATFTNNTGGTFDISGFITGATASSEFTGGTVTGDTIFTNNLSANSFSASTYLGLPIDIFVTGGTYSNSILSLNRNDGVEINVSGFSTGFTQTEYWTSGSTGTFSIKANNDSGLDATGSYSTAEGYNTQASGNYSHSEGAVTISIGECAHTEGNQTTAIGNFSHAEGLNSISNGITSHAEGNSQANGEYSHSEGFTTVSNGYASHTEGEGTQAGGFFSGDHAEGSYTIANGGSSHAEGSSTQANGISSHAEGTQTTAAGNSSHSEGYTTTASGDNSHSEGYNSIASGFTSHAEGYYTQANFDYSHAEGNQTKANNYSAHAEGVGSYANGQFSHAEGGETVADGDGSHSEGAYTTANGLYSHAEGYLTQADGENSHAEGYTTLASGYASHAEGSGTTASGVQSHAGGDSSKAYAINSFVHGLNNIVDINADNSVALGGDGITALTKNTVYVPYLNITQANDNTDDSLDILLRQPDGTIDKRPITGLPYLTSDYYTTGMTFNDSSYILTGYRNDGGSYSANLSGLTNNNGNYLPLSGGTVTGGTVFTSGLTANTLSATTVIVGNTGTEGSVITVNNLTFDSSFKISDIDGSNVAQTIFHKHSTTAEPMIIGARSNSDNIGHSAMTAGQNVFTIYGSGTQGSNYKINGQISIATDILGSLSNTSSPGKIDFYTTPNASIWPELAMSINNQKQITGYGILSANTAGIFGTDTRSLTNPERLLVNDDGSGGTGYSNTIVGKSNVNNYAQLNIQNTSSGSSASSDVVATANNGSETVNFIDMGINSSTFNGTVGAANDAYLYSAGNNLIIANATSGKTISFLTDGITSGNTRMSIASGGTYFTNVSTGNTTNQRQVRIWQDRSWLDFGSYTADLTRPAIYMNIATPGSTNHILSSSSDGLQTYMNGFQSVTLSQGTTNKLTVTNAINSYINDTHTFSSLAKTSGAQTLFTLTPGANVGQTASTEIPNFKIASATKTWATGALATQRWNYMAAQTAIFSGASVITNSYGLYVEPASAGTNTTITNNWALGTNGNVQVGGSLSATTYLGLPAFNSPYQTLRNGGGSLPAANGDGTYYLTIGGNSLATCTSGVGNAFVPSLIYIAAADYPTVNGLTPKLRVRATVAANNQSFSGSTNFGLYPMGSLGGALGVKIHTLGAVISGSTVSGSSFGNTTYTVLTGNDFPLPADGWYCIAFAKVGTIPSPNGFVEFQADLQLHYS